MLLSAETINIFSLANQIKFTIEAGYQLIAPVETSKFVPVTHYDVSITSRLAKIFNQLPYFVQIFRISIFSATTGKNFM